MTLRRAALLLGLLPALAQADPKSAAEAALAAHRHAAVLARQQAQEQAGRAAALAQQQVRAAAAVRQLEDETAADTQQLASLNAQQNRGRAAPASCPGRARPAAAGHAAPGGAARRRHARRAATAREAVRAIAVLQGIGAQIETEAETVKTETTRLGALVNQTKTAQAQLTLAVAAQESAEAQLSAQITAARSAEMAAAGTAAQEDIASHAAQRMLDSIAASAAAAAKLAAMQRAAAARPTASASDAGAPVAGHVLQAYGAATPAGPAQGISYGAAPGGRVTAPCAGTVLFAGAFPSYGHVVIAGCGAGTNIVLAGMARLDVATGEHVANGQPVGEMQGYDPAAPTRQPILYVELRRNGTPVDPSLWLAHGHF